MNTHSHMPGNMAMHGSPAAASPIAALPGGAPPAGWSGASAPTDVRSAPFPAAPVAVGSAPATGVRGTSGSAVRDPFAASEPFDHSTGSRMSSMHATGDASQSGATGTGQTTASAPVSPTKRTPQQQRQAFGTGAHTADGVRKATGDAPVGSTAAAAEAKKRVLPSVKQPQSPPGARSSGAVVSPRAGQTPGSPSGKVQLASAYALTGAADVANDAGGSDRHPAVAGMKQSTRLTSRKVKAAAYAAMSGVDGDDSGGDIDGLSSAMSQLQMENERLRAELAARMAGGPAAREEAAALEEKEELVRKLRTTEEELEQRRLQVGEMRSIIDAISVPAPAAGVGVEVSSQAVGTDGDGGVASPTASGSRTLSPKKNGNSMGRHRAGFQEVSQRVWAILNETAGWQRSGLRRSVSEVHVAWSEFDDDSPLHP